MVTTTRKINPESSSELLDLYERAKPEFLSPLWEVFSEVLTPEPRVNSVPYLWRYDTVRPLMLEAADLITAEKAERRVLVLENPGLGGEPAITETLYAGIQLILPGEIAPAHRHSPSALRFMLEGTGAYTAVNGEKSYMEPGDFVLTSSWQIHDHGNEGDAPALWLDVLDLPLVRRLGPMFLDTFPGQHPAGAEPDDSLYRYGTNMKPIGFMPETADSPVINYRYSKAREALDKMKLHHEWDACHGLKMEYINPMTGGSSMATMSTFIQLLPARFTTNTYQTTEGIVFSVIEGSGKVTFGVGDNMRTIEWQEKDTFVIPCWCPFTLEAVEEAVLFSATDKVVQSKLGLWREKRAS